METKAQKVKPAFPIPNFVLTNFACGGKSSLLPALKWHLELKFNATPVITFEEPVSYGLSAIKQLDIGSDFEIRQSHFIATSIAQAELVLNLTSKGYLTLMDRNIIDVLIFTYLNRSVRSLIVSEVVNHIYSLPEHIQNFIYSSNYMFINIPQSMDVIIKCFDRQERKETIQLYTFRQDAELFKEVFFDVLNELYSEGLFVGRVEEFESPADNSYVLYKILDWIVDGLVLTN